jgi:hypothetical protein
VQPRDNSGDSPARFLAELRALRAQSALSHADLAARAHYPSDLLRSAEVGPSLPDLPVLSAYVRGCGGETADWEDRWRVLSGIPALPLSDGLPSRPAGGSAAASAGAAAGVSAGPVDERESAFIMAVLARVTAAASASSAAPAAPTAPASPPAPASPASPASTPALPTSVAPPAPPAAPTPEAASESVFEPSVFEPTASPSVFEPASPSVFEPASPSVFEPASPSVFEPASPSVFEPASPSVFEPAAQESSPAAAEPAPEADPATIGAMASAGAKPDSAPVWTRATAPVGVAPTRSNGTSQVNGYRSPSGPVSHAATSGAEGILSAIPKQVRLPLLVGAIVIVLIILLAVLV